MKLFGKYQTLWILLGISISITESLANEDDAADNLSRPRLNGPSCEITGIYKRRRRCTGTEPPVAAAATELPEDCTVTEPPEDCTVTEPPEDCTVTEPPEDCTVTEPPEDCTVTEPQKLQEKDENVQKGIDLTFPGCGKRSPDVQERTRRGGLRLEKRDLTSRFRRTRFRRFDALHRPDIVGGSQANTWPWMVALFKTSESGGKTFFCGASLISRRYVLSAAHCFDGENGTIDPSKFNIMVGAQNTKDGIEHSISNVLTHPGYQKRDHLKDISILQVDKDVQLSKQVYPVCLPSDGMRKKASLNENQITVTGWGDTTFGGKTSKLLREVTMPLVPLKNCSAEYASEGKFPNGMPNTFLCAGLKKGGKDSCQGDSGGPMVNKLEDQTYIQLGIVSFGHHCAEPFYPGVYTRVAAYTKWLYDNTDLGRRP